MQTSGTFPGLSDGVRKTIVGKAPNPFSVRRAAPAPKAPAAPKASTHRAGGHAKHARRAK